MADETRDNGDIVRGRPGRRSVVDRQQAVLELLSGKASVDQLAQRYGVKPETIEGWRAAAARRDQSSGVKGRGGAKARASEARLVCVVQSPLD